MLIESKMRMLFIILNTDSFHEGRAVVVLIVLFLLNLHMEKYLPNEWKTKSVNSTPTSHQESL